MTNKEAIRILGLERDEWDISHCTASERREAFDMAITALENNSNEQLNNSTATQFNAIKTHVKGLTACRVPEDDCISRADVEQTVEDNILCYTHSDRPIDQDPDTECHMAIRTALRMLRKDLRKLPSVQPEQDREFLKLTVRNSNGRPYYSIIYLEVDDNGVGHDFEGYSSYSLDVISDYLKKYFMPSVQPETCDTCKHGYFGDEQCNNCRVRFTSHYERRNDGSD